ncbi:hypothetical protein CR513_07534, partial [Mucuna pruriens]
MTFGIWSNYLKIFKTKKDSKGNIKKYKAHLVAKGFTPKEGIDYKETFSLVSSKDSCRTLMTLVTHFDLELHQMDVNTTFLNGDIDETIYMMQSENFVSNEYKSMVCKLKKSIYGLKQASRQWYDKFHQVIISYGFEEIVVYDCVYHKFSGSLLHETKRFMTKNFEMKDLGETSFVLGIQILRDRSQGILRMSQENYISKVLERFDMKDSKLGDTPIAKGDKFSLKQCPNNDLERNKMQKIPYASAMGSLMYAQVCTHSNIAFVVGVLGSLKVWRSSSTLTLILQDVKTANAPHLDTSTCWLEELALRSLLRVVDDIERPLKIYRDNNLTVLYSNNNRSSTKSKFIDIKFLVVKERVKNKQIFIEHI